MASNWMPISKIQGNSSSAYQLEEDCKKSGEQCLDIGNDPEKVSAGFSSLVNDWGPISEDESCEGEADCTAKLEQKVCPGDYQKFINADYLSVYCVQYLGKKISFDEVGYSAHQAGKLVKAQIEALIANGARARGDCQRVLDLIGGFNLLPGRSSEQAGQMVSTFAEAKQALQDGRPTAAKAAINSIPVDGILVTQSMKDLALDILKDW